MIVMIEMKLKGEYRYLNLNLFDKNSNSQTVIHTKTFFPNNVIELYYPFFVHVSEITKKLYSLYNDQQLKRWAMHALFFHSRNSFYSSFLYTKCHLVTVVLICVGLIGLIHIAIPQTKFLRVCKFFLTD